MPWATAADFLAAGVGGALVLRGRAMVVVAGLAALDFPEVDGQVAPVAEAAIPVAEEATAGSRGVSSSAAVALLRPDPRRLQSNRAATALMLTKPGRWRPR